MLREPGGLLDLQLPGPQRSPLSSDLTDRRFSALRWGPETKNKGSPCLVTRLLCVRHVNTFTPCEGVSVRSREAGGAGGRHPAARLAGPCCKPSRVGRPRRPVRPAGSGGLGEPDSGICEGAAGAEFFRDR